MSVIARARTIETVRIALLLRLQGLESANQLAEPAGAAPFAVNEAHAGLVSARMVDDPSRKVERRFAARRRDLEDDVGADRRLHRPQHQPAADADLAQLGVEGLEGGGHADLAR